MNTLFQSGSQKVEFENRGIKRYHPYLYRLGRRRYAGRGQMSFKTATAAQEYSRRWNERASRFLAMKENSHVG